MALTSPRRLLDHAAERSHGLPAFNVNDMEQVQAIMPATEARALDSMAAACAKAAPRLAA